MLSNLLKKIDLRDEKEASNLALFILGKFISVFGTSIYTFAIGLYVLKSTGSGLRFATTLLLGLVPIIIINPVAGVMADRFDKKKIVISMDLLNGFLFIALYVISSIYGLNLLMIYLSAFFTTAFTTIFGISFEAAKPNIVSDKKLISINSVSRIIDSLSSILGPVMGGLIFALIDIKSFILVNGLSFILSAILEIFIDFKYNFKEKNNGEIKTGFFKDIKDGFKYMMKRRDIIEIFNVFLVLNFFISFSVTVPLPYIINNVLKLTTKEYGIIQSAFPMGMIIGALFVKKVIEKIPYKRLLISMSILLSISMISLGVPLISSKITGIFYLLYYLIIMIIFGISIAFIDIPILYLLQKVTPDEFRGRVLSMSMSIGKIVSPIALIIAGFLLNILPSYTLPMAGGSLLLIANVIILNGSVITGLDTSQPMSVSEK